MAGVLTYAGVQLADVGAASLTWGRQLQRDAAGRPVGYAVKVDVNKAMIACAGAADAALKMAAVQAVLDVYGGDLTFDGGRAVYSATTLGGISVSYGPVWLSDPGGNGITFISYACGFEWEYLRADAAALVDFQESVRVQGGEPLVVVRNTLNLGPVEQRPIPLQGWRATQSGRAVGLRARPNPPAPLWPTQLYDKTFTAVSGRRVGVAGYRDFETQWAYEFASATPLAAVPNEWLFG